uniref:Uncharacterized protein n=2 Tax=Ixodes scapularis TaxID=6945 RepID=A0A1S4KR28_IXOSC
RLNQVQYTFSRGVSCTRAGPPVLTQRRKLELRYWRPEDTGKVAKPPIADAQRFLASDRRIARSDVGSDSFVVHMFRAL